jgi:membrane protein
LKALAQRATGVFHRLVDPLLRFNFIDRSLALGAQAFGAVIPLLIVIETAQPGNDSLADETTTTVLSVIVLVVAALSFTRRLQRLYEESWSLATRGVRGTGWGLLWLGFLTLYLSLHPVLDSLVNGLASTLLTLAGGFVVGLVTPLLLLGRRKRWQALVPQASLTAVGLTGLGVWTAVYMPHAIGSSAANYGAIGVAFALLTWLWGLGIVLVCAAVFGSPQMKWRELFRA